MSKQKKDNSNIVQWVIPTILLLLFLIITLLNYNSEMKADAKTKVISKVKGQISTLGSYYEDSISSLVSISEIAAQNCTNSADVFADRNVQLLSDIVDRGNLKKAYIMKMDGSAVDQNKNFYMNIRGINDSKKDLLNGRAQITSYMKDEDGDYILLIVSPIKTSSQMLGAIILAYKPNKLEEITDTPDYFATNTYALISDEGIVLECTNTEDFNFTAGSDFFEEFEKATFLDGSMSLLRQYIRNQKSGEVEIERSGEKVKFLICDSVENAHASVVMLTNHTQIERSIKDENRSTTALMYKITISILIFVLILVTINVISRTRFIKENKELQNQAETDLLTDLLNKIATEKKIKEYLLNEGKEKKSIMFVLDVDNFKKINDTMGHAFGDEVLRTLGKQLRAEFRVNDIIGRTGGDEFTIFLKDLKDDAIMKREAERVAQFFRNFKVGEYTKYFATASIGAAIYPDDAGDFETLYKWADKALYKAKKRGKNQLAFYNDEEEPEMLQALSQNV